MHSAIQHKMNTPQSKSPPIIAIIGCDGSGKSTVSERLLDYVNQYIPAKTTPLGKQQGNVLRSLAKLPLLGKWIEDKISQQVKKVNRNKKIKQAPTLLPAFVIYLFTLRRIFRFNRMLALRKRGYVIITDRYPQLEVTQAYDTPDLIITNQGHLLVKWLAKKERQAFEWMTSYIPDLVIRLNVDIDTACKRKPDHKRELLERKIAATPKLTFNGAKIVDIDATQPLDHVLQQAQIAIHELLKQHGYI